jgi:small subunit ribosomal protein S17
MRTTTRKTREGIVVSDRMNKTVIVRVDDRVQHPIYKRVIRKSARFHAHDETNDCHTGDRVKIMETRPLSATKRWRVVEVVERAK